MRAWMLLVTFAVAALAGCADEPKEVAATDDGPLVIENPDDYTYVGNATFDNGGHIHNYWGGQDSLPLLDATETGIVGMYGLPNVTVHVFRPDERVVVPQGAGRVDVTVTWVNDAMDRNGDVELWIKTAADNVPRPVTTLTSGEMVSFEHGHADNDLPHQVLSAWEFHIVANLPDNGLPGRWNAETTIEAEVHKLLDIPVYPAHPDQWQNRTEIVLIDEARATAFQTQDPVIQGCGGAGCMYAPYDFIDGAIVPLDAEAVLVELTWSGHPQSRLGLMFHGADTREWSMPAPNADAPGSRGWVIPVDGIMGDGPYSLQSLWEINVFIEDPSMLFTGDYHLTATAVAPLP